jgi:hypothetical protein
MIYLPDYIWRGQRCSDWHLIPSLDRLLKRIGHLNDGEIRRSILRRFKLATRGRLDTNAKSVISENEWWALGQHFGLASPLLDWTSSPFIASYFAFAEQVEPQPEYRAVYGLSARMIFIKCKALNNSGVYGNASGIQFISPLTNDNPRLLHQRGIFTRAPDGVDVESWVRKHFSGREDKWVLIKVLIPDKARAMFLRSLERMAISPLELFPDISGASLYCNLSIEVKNYCQSLVDTDIFNHES